VAKWLSHSVGIEVRTVAELFGGFGGNVGVVWLIGVNGGGPQRR
jgi:hypothetical protein